MTHAASFPPAADTDVAIVGMSGRFPGAKTLQAFWSNLRSGTESIRFFGESELVAAGVDPALARDPSYVAARGVLEDAEFFDAGFFGLSPREAALTDPQHRVFLECCWEALEAAGYDPARCGGAVGVFAGAATNHHAEPIRADPSLRRLLGDVQIGVGNEIDFLANRVSFKLGLRGPSFAVQSACSTGLVAVHQACLNLLHHECDMALAGAVSIRLPQLRGYRYEEGGILSPDGHCRAFDAAAAGTVGGNGAGVVVLKRLVDALADGDTVRAVLKGSAVNNDGAHKAGYTAPGVEAQAEVIAAAHAVADVEPRSIGYVEAHGTGTPLGDPVEIAALTRAFGSDLPAGACALGSVKTNIGHLNTAAGIAGLIKTVLCLEHRELPASLHFRRANPKAALARSPFRVNTELCEWKGDGAPLRAGVSSFGMGGTNAHVVLEEAPARRASGPVRRGGELVLLSARSEAALATGIRALHERLAGDPGVELADAASTLRVGRHAFAQRAMAVCRDREDALAQLAAGRLETAQVPGPGSAGRPIAFLLPGLGDHYLGMGGGLYRDEPRFREHVDRCAEALLANGEFDPREILRADSADASAEAPGGGLDLRRMLERGAAASGPESAESLGPLATPERSHPALFTLGYALGRTLMDWGVRPGLMLGHSLGEYVAACLAGVFRVEDAVSLVAGRARLVASTAPGAMLAVPRPPAELAAHLGERSGEGLALSLVNGPALCVVTGSPDAVAGLRDELAAEGVPCRWVQNSHRIHSPFMEPLAEELVGLFRQVALAPPRIPFVSNVDGRVIRDEDATSPDYWARQLCEPARFDRGLESVWRSGCPQLLEVGPGQTLGSLAWQHPARGALEAPPVLPTLRPAYDRRRGDRAFLLGSLGRLWLQGGEVDWDAFQAGERRLRIALPTHPFERERHWIEGDPEANARSAIPVIPAAVGPAPEAAVAPVASAAPPPSEARALDPDASLEDRLRGVWQELLGIAGLAEDAHFLELGGHSLLAIQLAARVLDEFGVALPLRSLLDAPTLGAQARLIGELQSEAPREAGSGAEPGTSAVAQAADSGNAQAPFPLTDVQQAYWIGRVGKTGPDAGGVAAHGYVELDCEDLDVARLEAACRRLVERHGMLRAVVSEDGEQRILAEVPPFEIDVQELRGAAAPDREAELEEIRERLSHRVLPAESWPLFRIQATRLSPRRTRLHVNLDLLIGDAWSWWNFFDELARLYRDAAARLPEIGLDFRDYVMSERARHDSPEYARARSYWRARVDELPPPPELPRLPIPSSSNPEAARFARLESRLDATTWQQLTRRARRAGLTPSGVLLAAFAEVLTVWSGSPRFTLNLTLFDRLPIHPQVDRLFGDFTSLTLLAVDHSEPVVFRERAQRLQARLWEDLDHRAYGGVRVLRELAQQGRSLSAGVMPVVFTSTLGLGLSGKAAAPLAEIGEVVHGITQTPHVWLDHQVCEEAGELVFNWDHVEGLFPEGLVEAMFEGYVALLGALAEGESAWQADPAERVRALVPAAQLARREAVNATAAPLPDQTLHGAFLARMAEAPERTAVVGSDGERLSYAELARRAEALAEALRSDGVVPEEPVAIFREKGAGQVVAAVGILGAGAAYLPTDPSHPAARIAALLERAGVTRVLTQPSLQPGLDTGLRRSPGLRTICEETLPRSAEAPRLDPGAPDSLAYVIHTSGTTGTPGGVMISHRSALNTLLDLNRRIGLGPDDAVFGLSSLGFDLSVYDLFGTLAAGARVVLPEEARRRDPAHWIEQMHDHEVSVWNSVPALMGLLVECLEGRGERLPPSLRVVLLSGDWIPVTLPDRIRALGDVQVISLGGATEASVWSVVHPVEQVDPEAASIPYGVPLANQQLHVLGPELEPRPEFVPGELYLGGAGLARGYLGDEARTRERFLVHPRTGERLYRTGDLGRALPDGSVEFLGREDGQVKIRGHRVELGEIEAALVQHPDVEATAVAAPGEPGSERRLVGYVVGRGGACPAPDTLRGFLLERLPEALVPTRFVGLDALPRSANGKVDRRRLSLPRQEEPGPLHARQDDRAGSVARLVAGILELPEVALDADFFRLGASSLDMVRIANALESRFGHRPRIDDLYAEPTVAGILSDLEREGEGTAAAETARAMARAEPTLVADPKALAAVHPELLDPAAREAFQAQQAGRMRPRPPAAGASVGLSAAGPEALERYATRRSHRHFALRSIESAAFGGLLHVLGPAPGKDSGRRLYASAGGLYPVQAFVYVKAGRVADLPQGTYLYEAEGHRLAPLARGAEIPSTAYGPLVNRPVFEEAAFSIFLVAQIDAIAPLYGDRSLPYCLVEAGYMGQLLMNRADECGLGLCPVGDLDFAGLRPLFGLDDGHVLVHSLLGGAPDAPAATTPTQRATRSERLLERVRGLAPREAAALLAAEREAPRQGEEEGPG